MSRYWHRSAGKMKVFSWGLLILSVLAVNAHAQAFLGTSWQFSVLGAQTVTNTGATTLNADLGVSPGTAVTGSGTITFSGAAPNNVITSTATAAAGQSTATAAVADIAGLSGVSALGSSDLTGQALNATGASGTFGGDSITIYSGGALSLDTGGVLTLNFEGLSDETIVLVASSTLITGSGSGVDILGGNSTDEVDWVVGSSATLGTTTSLVGNIIASASVSLDTGATIGCGSVVAQTGAVTMEGNTISNTCNGLAATTGSTTTPTPVTPIGGGGTTTVSVPEGGSTLLYLCSFLLPLGAMRGFRFRRSI
jgi:type VI secretion system secreted protein VgrG